MTTHQLTHELCDPPPTGAVSVDAAVAYVATCGFTESSPGPVGLELEFHVVDASDPCRRVDWPALVGLAAIDGALPNGCRFTVEPGGQVELSTPPLLGVAAAVDALRGDRVALGAWFAQHGLGLVPLGADPARALQRVNPASRYRAMEQHFDSLGYGLAGRSMMTATAALQINVDAGPSAQWADRLSHLTRLVPVLSAISACSPMLAGRTSGWRSMRQQAWLGMDSRRTGALPHSASPDEAWGWYAMHAPVMLVRDRSGTDATAVRSSIPFAAWWTGHADLGRAATVDDLDYHLTTLFPPIRPKGYLEFRTLDAVPDRWWPALAAIAVTLMDDPVAIDLSAEVLDGVGLDAERAARFGLSDPVLASVALRCVDIAAARVPTGLIDDVDRYRAMVASGRTPGDELVDIARASGPIAMLRGALSA